MQSKDVVTDDRDLPMIVSDKRTTPFFQIDNAIIDDYLSVIGHTCFALYCVLVRTAGRKDECFPSRATIAADMGASVETVRRSLRVLESHRLIRTAERFSKNGGRTSSIYYILDAPKHPPLTGEGVPHTENANTPTPPSLVRGYPLTSEGGYACASRRYAHASEEDISKKTYPSDTLAAQSAAVAGDSETTEDLAGLPEDTDTIPEDRIAEAFRILEKQRADGTLLSSPRRVPKNRRAFTDAEVQASIAGKALLAAWWHAMGNQGNPGEAHWYRCKALCLAMVTDGYTAEDIDKTTAYCLAMWPNPSMVTLAAVSSRVIECRKNNGVPVDFSNLEKRPGYTPKKTAAEINRDMVNRMADAGWWNK